MKFGNLFKKIALSAATLFVVGAALGAVAPLLAGAIGEATLGTAVYTAAMGTSVAWTAAFFGAFGAINEAITPVMKKFFSGADAPEKRELNVNIVVKKEGHAQEHEHCHDAPKVVNVSHNTVTNNDIDVTNNIAVDAHQKTESNLAVVGVEANSLTLKGAHTSREDARREAALLGPALS